MIVGMGQDMVDIRRIEKSLARFGKRFEDRVFTALEQKKAQSRSKSGLKIVAGTYAKRFAAKEACAKALGTGLNFGVFWKDMEVINLPTGQPSLKLAGGAEIALLRLIPSGMKPSIQLSLTDEYPHAQALVIISAVG